MSKNSNLAYAIKKLEEEPREKNGVQIRQYIRPKAVTRKKMMKNITFMMIYIVLLCAALIYGKVKLSEENNFLEATKTEYQELSSDYTRLESEVGKLASLKNIEQKAKEVGMGEVKPNQVVNIVVSSDNEVQVADKNKSLSVRFSDWLMKIKEYIVG